MEIQRESIFVSSLRGFCRSLFAVLGVFLACTIAFFIFSALSSPYRAEEKTSLVILPDLESRRDLVPLNAPVILRINIHGIIGDPQRLDSEIAQAILLDSREGILQNDRVKGILLHFNTPGGGAVDSDNIYRLLCAYKERYKVPIFGYVDGLCASGGMYIASAADKLFCSPTGAVGSVGVVMGPFFNVSDVLTKFGIESRTLTQGLDKDMMNPVRPWKADEDETLKKVMAHLYQRFVDVVTSARPNLNKAKLVEEYGAKIFDGPTARQFGYVDVADSDYATALTALLKEANVDIEKPYQIVELQPLHSFFSEFVQGRSPLITGKLDHRLQIGPDRPSAVLQDRFAYLYTN